LPDNVDPTPCLYNEPGTQICQLSLRGCGGVCAPPNTPPVLVSYAVFIDNIMCSPTSCSSTHFVEASAYPGPPVLAMNVVPSSNVFFSVSQLYGPTEPPWDPAASCRVRLWHIDATGDLSVTLTDGSHEQEFEQCGNASLQVLAGATARAVFVHVQQSPDGGAPLDVVLAARIVVQTEPSGILTVNSLPIGP
jgi:hypothetical protein